MSAPQHIASITAVMLTPCPLCKAQPMQPCHNGRAELRFTHAERNRA